MLGIDKGVQRVVALLSQSKRPYQSLNTKLMSDKLFVAKYFGEHGTRFAVVIKAT